MRKALLLASAALLLAVPAFAEEELEPKQDVKWPFSGPFGHVDKEAAQRGFQVYKEVCSACHGLSRIAFRNLQDIGFSEGEVKALAASYQIHDGPNDQGQMFDRPGKPSDHFVPPFANEEAARAAMSGAYPPDLSLIIKARHDGANYVYSILTGFQTNPPAGVTIPAGKYYDPYFPGEAISMPPPLSDDRVAYADGTHATTEQEARDVVVFLQWAAEPEMEARKQMGIKVMLYLLVFTGVMFVAKKRIWARLGKH